MRNNWFSREGLTAALPPNVEAGRMAGIIRGTLLGAVFGGGILFACRYGSAYQSLMEWDPVRNRSVVRAGARMLPFWQTMEPALPNSETGISKRQKCPTVLQERGSSPVFPRRK